MLVLGFFCGIRPEGELSKLAWSDLRFDKDKAQVVIRPEVSKTHRRRFIDVSANAIEWLRLAGIKKDGLVLPLADITLRRKRRDMCKNLGIRWIQQGMRHSFCSYWLAIHEDADKLVLQSGHTDAQTMWEHYHAGVTRESAQRFWSIVP